MANDGSDDFMECLLNIDTSDGWEGSLTKVLASFKDVRCDINPSEGYIYVKGKADPQTILMKLKRGGKHATIQWISYGIPREQDPYPQFQDPASFYNNHFMSQDPYSRYPYDTSYQLNPYYSGYNMSQNALPYGDNHVHEYEPSGLCEGRNSGQFHNPYCSMHSQNHHNSPESSQGGNGIPQMRNPSPLGVQPETNFQANNHPASQKSSRRSIMRIIGKCLCFRN